MYICTASAASPAKTHDGMMVMAQCTKDPWCLGILLGLRIFAVSGAVSTWSRHALLRRRILGPRTIRGYRAGYTASRWGIRADRSLLTSSTMHSPITLDNTTACILQMADARHTTCRNSSSSTKRTSEGLFRDGLHSSMYDRAQSHLSATTLERSMVSIHAARLDVMAGFP